MQADKISRLEQEPFGPSGPFSAKGGSLAAFAKAEHPRFAWADIKSRLATMGRQFPWVFPRRVIRDAVAWVGAQQAKASWYQRSRGCSYTPFRPAEVVTYNPPPDLPAHAWRAVRAIGSLVRPRAGLFRLINASLFSDEGVVFSPHNELFDEFSHRGDHRPLAGAFYRRPFRSFRWQSQIVEQTTAVLATPNASNYYHWLFDVLPRLHLLREVRPSIGYYALPAHLNAWQRETLHTLGVRDEQILPLQPEGRILCREIYVPSLPGSEGCSPPWAVEFLRAHLLPPACSRTPVGAKLYVSRGQGGNRPILHEDELIERLQARGFAVVDPGSLPVSEQAGLFRDAEIIVAAHGAALSNLVFAERAKVLELFSRDYLRLDCYYTLACLRGLQYRCWIDPTPPGTSCPWGAIDPDADAIERSIDELERA